MKVRLVESLCDEKMKGVWVDCTARWCDNMLIDGLEKGLAWDFESGKGDLKATRNRFYRLRVWKVEKKVVSERIRVRYFSSFCCGILS